MIRSVRRRWIIAVTAVLVAGGLTAGWVLTHRQTTTTTTTTRLVAASVSTVRQTVSATGTIVPKTQANLSFASSGTVDAVNVAMGDTVKSGQVLATIDPADLDAAVSLAQANLDAAYAAVTAATSAGSSATQLASLNAQARVAKASLASVRSSRSAASLTSPVTGVVAEVNIADGDRVTGTSGSSGTGSGSAGSGSGSGSGAGTGAGAGAGTTSGAQIIVITTNAWMVDATVGSADIGSLKKGMQAEITPTGTSTTVFGTVSAVGLIASTSGSTTAFPVTIAVTGSPAGLHAGAGASVAIVVRQITDALTVPTAAVTTENGATVVHQLSGDRRISTPVTVGGVYGSLTQITTGLAEGDQVVVTGTVGQGGQSRTRSSNGTRTGTGGFGGVGGIGGGAPGNLGGAPPGGGP
ncbi:MAG: biotin/lipoyl-binding protein [Kineosporiaceae bacterium]